jgi:hypothetical protein
MVFKSPFIFQDDKKFTKCLTKPFSKVTRPFNQIDFGPIAQLVEPPAHNRTVPGSRPGGPIIYLDVQKKTNTLKKKQRKCKMSGVACQRLQKTETIIRRQVKSHSEQKETKFFKLGFFFLDPFKLLVSHKFSATDFLAAV